ncbi:C3a anaphylatoxin chemotactic receptor-like [Hypanus sabinus]|uniref:C3a anaphylatoxin chemotactic receptor-like n=1 Tax=Hypanus sabinus TaxID=79690 RepID=UPI0028C44EFA|nr:C3a anaphylatoxin chemotactic receptor-like [Hypanus sabinus]
MSSPEDRHWAQYCPISHKKAADQQESMILSMIIFTITFLLGVPGNSAVIWVTGFKIKTNVHSVCFLNLAVADLAFCFTLPFWIVYFALRGTWVTGDIAFNLLLISICFNGSASVFLLTVISIFRCLSVTQAIWFRRHLSQCWARVACSAAWVFALLICLIALQHSKLDGYFGNTTWNILKVTWAVVIFVIPILIMAFCYFLIVRKLRADRFTKSRKSVRVILTVVVVFIICWFPYHICSATTYFFGYFSLIWHDVALATASFNSALNPLLYVFVGRKFRQVFKRSLANSLRLAFIELEPDLENDLPDIGVSTETRV